MTRKDLDRIFTAKVTGLLAQGFQIHTGTMRGSQGDGGHPLGGGRLCRRRGRRLLVA